MVWLEHGKNQINDYHLNGKYGGGTLSTFWGMQTETDTPVQNWISLGDSKKNTHKNTAQVIWTSIFYLINPIPDIENEVKR